jgi:4-hydroxybenzoate polyprenyltransferase
VAAVSWQVVFLVCVVLVVAGAACAAVVYVDEVVDWFHDRLNRDDEVVS